MLVREQPGDEEDLAGRPFVGPAGRPRDRALEEAGIDCAATYVTNAVKHSSGRREERGASTRSRAGRSPPPAVARRELEAAQPRVVVCLGATAAQSPLGRELRLTQHRGQALASDLERVTATVPPSSILRQQAETLRRAEHEAFVADLRAVASLR